MAESPKRDEALEKRIKQEFEEHKKATQDDLVARVSGVAATRGSARAKQFAGYRILEQFYRGDQWDHDEPPGASQTTDNYCAMIVDNFASLLFDAPVENNCPAADETDELLQMKAEIKEKMLKKVYDDNDADDIVLPDAAQNGSLYGDAFIKGPLLDKRGSNKKDDWKIVFHNVDNPANIRLIFKDEDFRGIYGFIDTTSISPMKFRKEYAERLTARGVDVEKIIKNAQSRSQKKTYSAGPNPTTVNQKMIAKEEFWTDEWMSIFIEDQLVDYWKHDWGFVPLIYVKNNRVPNHPYGKSDLEDVLDPQLAHNRTNNDLANALKIMTSLLLKGKNLEGMEVLVTGLNRIFNLPDEAELDALQRHGDPYAAGNFVDGRRRAILDVSGISEVLTASASAQNLSGRAMSVALQSVIRKLSPRIKRYRAGLRTLNANIFKLYEMYWPETKEIIMEDYTSDPQIVSTILRNIIDELNKLQSGTQSLTTTQRNLGIAQPRIEQKIIKQDLQDEILGPQIARQPGLLPPRVQNEAGMQGTPGSNGEQGLPSAPNQRGTEASPEGAVTAVNQQAAVAATPQVTP